MRMNVCDLERLKLTRRCFVQKMLKRGLSLFQKNDPQNGKENNKLEIGIINWSVFDRVFIK